MDRQTTPLTPGGRAGESDSSSFFFSCRWTDKQTDGQTDRWMDTQTDSTHPRRQGRRISGLVFIFLLRRRFHHHLAQFPSLSLLPLQGQLKNRYTNVHLACGGGGSPEWALGWFCCVCVREFDFWLHIVSCNLEKETRP